MHTNNTFGLLTLYNIWTFLWGRWPGALSYWNTAIRRTTGSISCFNSTSW